MCSQRALCNRSQILRSKISYALPESLMHWSQNLRRNKECALRKGYMQLVTVLDKSQRIYIPKELNANGHRIGVPSICALVHRI